MRVTKHKKDTIMVPTNPEEVAFCEQLMQDSDLAFIRLKTDTDGLYLEFIPTTAETIEED